MIFFLGSVLVFIRPFKRASLTNFFKMVERVLLVISHTNLRAWLNVLDVGQRRKTKNIIRGKTVFSKKIFLFHDYIVTG